MMSACFPPKLLFLAFLAAFSAIFYNENLILKGFALLALAVAFNRIFPRFPRRKETDRQIRFRVLSSLTTGNGFF
jgi:uncharacterized membrane protein YfcA